MGSFDAGYGTWYLEDLVGKKKAKEMWFLNPKLSAREALEIGLINKVVPDETLEQETRAMAEAVAERGAFALAAVKGAFVARHGGVSGMSRVSLDTDESKELGEAFRGKRSPDPDTFGH
jgi:naphthoate synthase